ncbi:translation initiation factor IF-2-like [Phyllostomus discolor]|uniref:Translation initiation factor IF-2-like n=1 Tax=Phyllostomus discolor TaxID=89673 RepID=A0A7E6CR06_9CHIR|nr:translation initiation factor IF-2-like [Phyllostomus discolor]
MPHNQQKHKLSPEVTDRMEPAGKDFQMTVAAVPEGSEKHQPPRASGPSRAGPRPGPRPRLREGPPRLSHARPPPGPLASPGAPVLPPAHSSTDSYGGGSRGHQGLLLAPAPPPHAPPNTRPGAGGVPALAGAGPRGPLRRQRGPKELPPGVPSPGPGFGHTDLSSPPRLGCGPRSSGCLTGRRRPRPPPPPATASFPFAAATAGAHAGPALLSPETEAGKGGAGAAEYPELVASRRSDAACPHRGAAGPAWPRLGCELLRARPRGGAEGGAAARGRERRVGRGDAQAGAAECARERRAVCRASGQGGFRFCRLLQSPRAQCHHLGENADLATAAKAGRIGGAGRVSRQAARATGLAATPGRGRGDAGLGSAPPMRGSAPLPIAVVACAGGVGKGKWLAALGVPPGSVAILMPGGGGSTSRDPLLSVAPQKEGIAPRKPRGAPGSVGEPPVLPNRGLCRNVVAPHFVGGTNWVPIWKR